MLARAVAVVGPLAGGDQILRQQPQRLARQHVRDRILAPRRGIGLDRMDHRVDPGRRGDVARQADGQLGVEHRPVGIEGGAVDRILDAAADGDDRDAGRLRAGARRGRHQRQRQPRAQRLADAPDRVEIVAAAEQVGGELGDVHRAAAAEADHRCAALARRHRRHQRLARRILLDRVEHDRVGQRGERRIGKAERADIGVGDEQAGPGRQQIAEPRRGALPGDQLRAVMELIGLHAAA